MGRIYVYTIHNRMDISMSDASDIFEQLIAMMLMGEIDKYGLELIPKIEVDEAEICKAEKMYEKKESN